MNNYEDAKFKDIETGEIYDWNTICYEFTTEDTRGELSDDEIGQLPDEEWVKAVEKYTNWRLIRD